jgi:hypothetical protein
MGKISWPGRTRTGTDGRLMNNRDASGGVENCR